MQSSNLEFLSLEMNRINLMIRRLVLGWEIRGKDWMKQFSGLSTNQQDTLETLEFAEPIENGESPHSYKVLEQKYFELVNAGKAYCNTTPQPRLLQLQQVFSLTPFEYNAFLVCLAAALDVQYEKVFGYLQNDVTRKLPDVSIILQILLSEQEDSRNYWQYFQASGTLLKNGLLQQGASTNETASLLQQEFIVAPEIVSWLLDAYQPAAELANSVAVYNPDAKFAADFSSPQLADFPSERFNAETPLVFLSGPDAYIRKATAETIAQFLNSSIFEINLDHLKSSNLLDSTSIARLLRDAWLNEATPLLISTDQTITDIDMKSVMTELMGYPSVVIVSSDADWSSYNARQAVGKPIYKWLLPTLGSEHRFKIWQTYLPEAAQVNPTDLRILSDQFDLSAEQIVNALHAARDNALQQDTPVTINHLYEAAREYSNNQLRQLAQKIDPRYNWQDIVLPPEETSILHEITSTVRDRTLVLESWGLGKKLVSSKGISALFAGEPGTGKTLAAQVIAHELGMDLYKIDLSTVVSKYIGETEKNLELIFTQARNSNAVLFFDEADAIFGKRSEVKDAHDRYANIEVGYLLQRMETYDGIVILATNLHSNMDEAFTRRLQFIVDFPFPDAAQRRQIWQVLFPPDVPREEDIDFQYFADQFKLAGGNIRNIIVNAAFLAASQGKPVGHAHLVHGVRRELKKLGRLIDEKEFVRL